MQVDNFGKKGGLSQFFVHLLQYFNIFTLFSRYLRHIALISHIHFTFPSF